jgi:ribokinase
MGRVVVVGSINQDVIVRVPRFVRPGETLEGRSLRRLPGGKGANQAVAAARAGAPTHLLGAVGRDSDGQALLDFLAHQGIDIAGVRQVGAPTGTAFIQVSDDGENSIVIVQGANGHVRFDAESAALGSDDCVLATFEVPEATIALAFEESKARGARTILNATPSRSFPAELLDVVDILVVNESELSRAAVDHAGIEVDDDPSLRTATRLLAADRRTVVATLGARGLHACDRGDAFDLRAHRVDVVDTTAAGDTFVGYLAAGLVRGLSTEEASTVANAAAALAVQSEGAAPSIPGAKNVDAFLAQNGANR